MINTVKRHQRRSSSLKLHGLYDHARKHHDRLTAMMIWAFLIQMTIILTCELTLPLPYGFQSSPGMFGNAHEINDSPESYGLRKDGIGDNNNIIDTALSMCNEAGTDICINEEYFDYSMNNYTKTVPRIDKDFPSADTIKSILLEEQHGLANHNERATVDDLATFYELVYAFIAAFRRHDIPIFVGYGSHLGARRHHGIIPFGEKDVDFEVFSVDEGQVRSIISEVLQLKELWSSIEITKKRFGFQLNEETMEDHGLKYFVDFWLFESNVDRDNQIICTGTKLRGKNKQGKTGCWLDYHHMGLRTPGVQTPPIFQHDDYFPPVYQVFGSHRVPIPRTSKELETSDYNIAEEHWNTSCATHRVWLGSRWGKVPKEGRECSRLYDKYPFVFKTEDGTEELRQGDIVVHRSELET